LVAQFNRKISLFTKGGLRILRAFKASLRFGEFTQLQPVFNAVELFVVAGEYLSKYLNSI
jgi:hypothetical protein